MAALSGVTTPYNTYWFAAVFIAVAYAGGAVATKMAGDSSPDQGDRMRNTKCWLTYLLPAIALAGCTASTSAQSPAATPSASPGSAPSSPATASASPGATASPSPSPSVAGNAGAQLEQAYVSVVRLLLIPPA